MVSLTGPFEGLFDDRRRVGLFVVAVLALAVVPYTTTRFVTNIFFNGLVFVLLGVSWNLIAGYTGQISLGHHAFFGLGAFVSAWLTTPMRAGFPESIQSSVLVAVAAAAILAGLLALVLGPILFRLTGHYFAIGTLAVAAIIQLVLIDQREFSGGATGYYVSNELEPDVIFLLMLVATVACILVTYAIVNSRAGLGMRAIHDDEDAASSLGINPLRYKMFAFVAASMMAGIAGGFYAQFWLYVNPESTLAVSWMVDTLVVVVLGGMGSIAGPLLGGALFVALDEGLRQVAGEFAPVIEGALIIAFIIYAPGGLYKLLADRFGDAETPTVDEDAATEQSGAE